MLIVSTDGATNISDVHEAAAGVFDVDADTAAHLLLFPGWRHATEEEARAHLGEPAPDAEIEEGSDIEPSAAKRTRKPRTAPPAE